MVANEDVDDKRKGRHKNIIKSNNSAAISKRKHKKQKDNKRVNLQQQQNKKTNDDRVAAATTTKIPRVRRQTIKKTFIDTPLTKTNDIHNNTHNDNDQLRDKLFYNHYLYRIITKSMHKKKLKRQMNNNKRNKKDEEEQGQEELAVLQLPSPYPITVSSDPSIITTWIDQRINSQFKTRVIEGNNSAKKAVVVVGMDCEWDPFRVLVGGQLIQSVTLPDIVTIATESSCLLYQTREGQLKPCETFVKLLQDHRVTKVWYDSRNDFAKLASWIDVHHQKEQQQQKATTMNALGKSSFDLHTLCKTGVNTLCREILSCQLKNSDEGNNIERWSRITLDESQISYAAKDAYANLRIFQEYHASK